MKVKVLQLVMAQLGFGVRVAPGPTLLTTTSSQQVVPVCLSLRYRPLEGRHFMCILQVGFLIFFF